MPYDALNLTSNTDQSASRVWLKHSIMLQIKIAKHGRSILLIVVIKIDCVLIRKIMFTVYGKMCKKKSTSHRVAV